MKIPPELFPAAARCVSLRVDPHPKEFDLSHYDQLHPLEKALVARAVPKRKAEFGDARWCGHKALGQLAMLDAKEVQEPILRGDKGMPAWPDRVVGSMTHTEGLRAAVVAPELVVGSLGLDAEIALPLPEGVIGTVARPTELGQLERFRRRGIDYADRILFCAKEATYKAWFPLTHRWLGFDDAEIDIRPDGTFTSYIMIRPTPFPQITGRWQIVNGYVLASCAVNWD